MATACSASSKLNDLRDALSIQDLDLPSVNNALDKVITEIYSRNPSPPPSSNEWLTVMKLCCDRIGSENPLLQAKCANIFLMLINTHKKRLTSNDIEFVLSWTCRCLEKSPDIVYLDFLQMLDSLIKNELDYFSTERPDLMRLLVSKLEENSSVSLPQDVRSWRIACLKSLSVSAPLSALHTIASSYFELVVSLEKINDVQSYSQTWLRVLEGFEILCSRSSEWINDTLQHLVVAIHTAMATGLNVPPSPMLQFPAHVIMLKPSQLPPVQPVARMKKRYKGKVKQVAWRDVDSSGYSDEPAKLQVETTPWLPSSDSEYSDSENSCTKRSKRLEAHVRHAAYNLFIHVVKLVGCKPILEWYCALFSRLIDAVHLETFSKPRCAAFGALAMFLSGSKIFLAQAQESEGKAFTSFSEVLAVQLTTLHSVIIDALNSVSYSDRQQVSNLFQAVTALIKVAPYHRLKSGLFDSLLTGIRRFTQSKHKDIICYVMQCLLETVNIIPVSSEVSAAIAASEEGNDEPWIFKYSFSYLDDDVNGISVFSWGVISGLCQNHFNVMKPHVIIIENRILSDMLNDKPLVPLLKALASILEKYLEDPEFMGRGHSLWDKLLDRNSPFLSGLQDLGKSAVAACTCLSLIGPKKFHMLTEDKKILIITLVFGCCSNELQIVRYSALNVLSVFLSYPQMSGEIQFVLDAKDHMIRALKDPVENVRVKATWAFSNLVVLLVENHDTELLAEISVYELLEAAVSLSSDTQKVKQNILRALGHVMMLVSSEDLKQPKWRATLEKGFQMLQHCATSGSLMKMRWNACHAFAKMLSNESLYDVFLPLAPSLIQSLCTIVISCNNFKVRMNACLALSAIKQRRVYGSLFIYVWQSLLEGLDNAENMPDFSEFKHQHGLMENLCSAICHMVCFVQPGDLSELQEILDSRLNSLSSHLKQCQERVTPEQAGALIRATSHIESISRSNSNNPFVINLLKAFRAAQISVP